jgi:O-methyltransferase
MADEGAALYLDLLKRVLTRHGFEDEAYVGVRPAGRVDQVLQGLVRRRFADRGGRLLQQVPVDPARRAVGGDLPSSAETMVGLERLDNIQHCVETVLADGVPGDLVETGVWRGGSCIFMRGVLRAHGISDRTVWVADSFRGLPPPDEERYPADTGDDHWTRDELAVSVDDVRDNFRRYGLLDDQVQFLVGWFKDTLPTAPIDRIAVARLDGDMYESTIDALAALYDKVSVGGFVIIDDYGAVEGCRRATEDFRADRGISDPITKIDWTGAYWRRSA